MHIAINQRGQLAPQPFQHRLRMQSPLAPHGRLGPQALQVAQPQRQFLAWPRGAQIAQGQFAPGQQLRERQRLLQVALDRHADKVLQSQIEVEHFTQPRGARLQSAGQTFPQPAGRLQYPGLRPSLVAPAPERVEELAVGLVEQGARGKSRAAQVAGGVERTQDRQELAEIVQERLAQMGNVVRRAANGTLVAVQALAAHAPGLQAGPEGPLIAKTAQELQVRLANHDIVGRGVVVQLLVPFLQKVTRHLFDVVTMHDLQDAIAHPLALAAPAHAAGDQTHKRARGLGRGVVLAQLQSQAVLSVSQLARLSVEAPLPFELPHGREAQPHEDQGQLLRTLGNNAIQEIGRQIETMPERP